MVASAKALARPSVRPAVMAAISSSAASTVTKVKDAAGGSNPVVSRSGLCHGQERGKPDSAECTSAEQSAVQASASHPRGEDNECGVGGRATCPPAMTVAGVWQVSPRSGDRAGLHWQGLVGCSP